MADMRSFDRRRKLADALLAQSVTPGQGGQMVGRYYVGSGLTDGLTKLGQALIARSAYKKADEEESAFNLESQQKQQAALDELMQATQGGQELDFNSIGTVEQGGSLQYKRGAPSNRELGMALMRAQNAGLDVGSDAMKLIVGNNAPTEALGVVQVDRDGNVWNLDKGNKWNKAPFSSQPKTPEAPKTRTVKRGSVEITEEWDGSRYVPIAEAPRAAPTPQLVQTDAGFEVVYPGQLPQGRPKPAGGAEPTEGERKAAASGLVMDNAESNFFAVNSGNGMSTKGYYASQAPGGSYLMSEQDQKAKQAMSDWYREKLRLESGATIGDNEAYEEAKRYFPVPGDGPQTIAQKAAARKVVMEGLKLKAGRAAQTGGATAPAAAGGFTIKRIK